MTLDVYSHGIRVSGYTRETFRTIAGFLEGLVLKEPRHIPRERRTVMELKKRFYGLTDDRSESYIHSYQLDNFLSYLKDRGIETGRVVVNSIPLPTSVPVAYDIYDHFVPHDYQVPIIETMADTVSKSRRLDLQTGKGKAGTLDSKIRIPGGWSTMGAMEIGTPIVAPDGTTTEVTGVHPQGKVSIYRVTMADGRSTEVCGEHLWQSYYVNTSKHKRWKVRTTLEMLRLISMPNPRVYLPLIEPEDQSARDVPIPPYTLGAILGDGCISHPTAVTLAKGDVELFERISTELLPNAVLKQYPSSEITWRFNAIDSRGGNPYIRALNELGLMGSKAAGKFIPPEYLEGSRAQRLALLQGLMDTDGTANALHVGGAISYCSTSYRLATGVQYLVRSLGGIASIAVRKPHYTYKGEKLKGQDAYQVNIRYPRPSELFTLPRKRARTNDDNQYAKGLKLQVKSIEYVGMKEAQCISVAHPDRLYVTDDFIVTHNTYCSLAALQKRGERAVIMIPPKYFGIWTKALKDTFKNFDNRYMTVSGSAEFKKLTEMAVEGELDVDIIIISSMTYRTYIEAYERFKEKIVDIGYMVMPPRFHEAVGAGYQINDEFHEDPGLVYRTDVYSNVAKQVYLSATPFTGNDFVTRMIDIMLPQGTECPLPDYDQYIKTVALMYSEPGITPKDYLTPFKNTYNHARYETRMALKKKRTDRYFDMVKRIVKGVYYRDREPGQKLLVLCATVKFIEQLTQYLKREFSDLQVGAHVAGSSFEKLLINDITVSTIKSAGTGVDIPDLRETLLLQATDSKKDNIQILGRLRHLKNYPGLTPRLTYLVCGDIPQHIRYHKSKQEHFKGKVIGHRVMKI